MALRHLGRFCCECLKNSALSNGPASTSCNRTGELSPQSL